MARKLLILTHDVLATGAALICAIYIRFEDAGLADRWPWLGFLVPAFILYAGGVYSLLRLHDVKWRFVSLPDFYTVVKATAILGLSLLILDYALASSQLYGSFIFGKITVVLYACLQILFLGGPRALYRHFRYARTKRASLGSEATPTLILGRAADAEVLLRAIESGAAKKIFPLGILSSSASDQRMVIRNVPVLGGLDDIEIAVRSLEIRGYKVGRLILTPSALGPEAQPEKVVLTARRLGIIASRLPSLDGPENGPAALRLAPIDVEDLLLRPRADIDYDRLASFVRGKSVAVTGGGGSIGAEICRRVVAFGAKRLLIIENSETALYSLTEELAVNRRDAEIEGRVADIRDRARILALFTEFRPEFVFHAAALKHVPILERDWSEGVKTNIFGSVNVADASIEVGARAMVMISTDKAIEPVSVLGATKRFAEMYCQARDADLRHKGSMTTRLISVRFGNVLASNGSVVPKFKAQIEAGGPITVTHPDMVRYFMTIREACDLVVTAATHALSAARSDVGVYVLNMGQPVKIVDLARRMIQLSGLEPERDIDIVFTGIRPGERLHEILFAREEPTSDIGVDGVLAADAMRPELGRVREWLDGLAHGLREGSRAKTLGVLQESVPDFVSPEAIPDSPSAGPQANALVPNSLRRAGS